MADGCPALAAVVEHDRQQPRQAAFALRGAVGGESFPQHVAVVPHALRHGAVHRALELQWHEQAGPAAVLQRAGLERHPPRHVAVANAKEIEVVGRDLYQCLPDFVDKYQGIGKVIGGAVKAHNDSISAFDNKVLPKGRHFAELIVSNVDESRLRAEAVEGQVSVPKNAANGEPAQP